MRNQTIAVLLAGTVPLCAQWLNYPSPGISRGKDGKPNLSAPAPRANGKPTLSGLWQTESAPPEMLERLVPGATNGAGEEPLSQYFINILSDLKPEEEPLRPAAREQYRQRAKDFDKESPLSRCLPEGMPLVEMSPAPYKIIETPGLTVMLYERGTTFRQIYTDGRKLPQDPQPTWLGYSVGRREGDWFVVETTGFNDRAWLDARGHTHSEALRLIERFHRLDLGHMELQITVDDPETYTRPFTIKLKQKLVPDSDLLESVCAENEKDAARSGNK